MPAVEDRTKGRMSFQSKRWLETGCEKELKQKG